MATVFEYKREAVRVLVMKCEGAMTPECKKFSVDPQITTYEGLVSLLAKAFDSKGELRIHYKVFDDYGQETYLPLLSDWDLDAAFIRASEPCLSLRVEIRPYEESLVIEEEEPVSVEAKAPHSLPGFIMNHVEKLSIFSMVQKALNLTEETVPPTASSQPPRSPLRDAEFMTFLNPIGQVVNIQDLRSVIYYGGIDPSLRKVVWKHILNVYPDGMSGKERMDYIKAKANEYYSLRDRWREMLKNGHMVGDLAYVTGMVRKDVLRTDRHHEFYAGNDDNKNIASLFNILTTYALNHPAVSYCQGMSDLASPLLVTMNDEAHAYICFCALMKRLSPNFLLDGITMTKRFQHLADALLFYDEQFYHYLKSYQADDLLFCYRWLLLEMKREFAFDDALTMLEVMWSSLPPDPPEKELVLFEQEFMKSPPVLSPRPKENAYIKICALRRGVNHHASLEETRRKPLVKSRPYTSLDDGALRRMDAKATSPITQQRVVKNLNEFFSLDLKKKNKGKKDDEQNEKNKQADSREFEAIVEPPRDVKLDLEKLDASKSDENCKNEEVYVWENPLGGELSPDGGNEVAPRQDISLSSKYIEGIGDISKPLGLLQRRRVTLEKLTTTNGRLAGAKSAPIVTTTTTAAKSTVKSQCKLPPPIEFGGGNPFLMFLCLTVLTQHREPIMRGGMDYNEMAMHFDKMVRKHDVNKVLNQARHMYENYVRQFGDPTGAADGWHLNV